MNKSELQQIILKQLEQRQFIAQEATQRAIDAATDEETVPEHKYDTLALEASYLAHGQAMRVQECEEDIRQYRELILRGGEDQPVMLTSFLVVVDENDQEKCFFIGPCAGGLSVEWLGKEVSVLTPNAPLGQALMGREVGDEVELSVAGKCFCYEIVTVC
ncbi:transcription elongation factor [Vibrio sp. T187]|uniref:GreA/GreB family elongation factor n=1 Tax=Vibrio TaxID=662 RepID=UPI0010C9AE27|nr:MULTISPECIES: GreA/GreB family elongation factor [Vibrio]MBW3698028.1 transcription elongation factor [Vibrio sp. T187]